MRSSALGALLLLGLAASARADEWEEDDEVVVEEDRPEAVDPAAEARANHARMHGAPEWANDPEVLVSWNAHRSPPSTAQLTLWRLSAGGDGGAWREGAAGDHDHAGGRGGRWKVSASRVDAAAAAAAAASRDRGLRSTARLNTVLDCDRTIFEDPELSKKFNFLQSVRGLSIGSCHLLLFPPA